MTRVNSGISVSHLSDEHILAEHREIKRIPNTKFTSKSIPASFKLGGGHVLFFSNKPIYTFQRYLLIYNECIKRGFNVQYYGDNWGEVDFDATTEYEAVHHDYEQVVERIINNVMHSPKQSRYYGKPITKEAYIEMLLDESAYSLI